MKMMTVKNILDIKFLKNVISLYMLTAARILFPLVTLPYLTRVLSLDVYGMVAYVKSLLAYVQILIDFGFMLSATKEIVNATKRKEIHNVMSIVSNTVFARGLLAMASFVVYLFLITNIKLLDGYIEFALIMFLSVALSVFLFDFYFQGIEEMSALATRFLWSKGISTVCIFLFVHSDADLMKMACIELICTLVSISLTFIELIKRNVYFVSPSLLQSIRCIKNSFVYFLSNFSTTFFNIFITFLIGMYLVPEELAYWSIALQLISGIQSLYSPIITSLYPLMIREKNIRTVLTIMKFAMPIIILSCMILYIFSNEIISIIAGEGYLTGAYAFRLLIPVLFFSFPLMVLGWPFLGAMGYERIVTTSTVFASMLQCGILCMLIFLGGFTLEFICISRSFVEFILFVSLVFFSIKIVNIK